MLRFQHLHMIKMKCGSCMGLTTHCECNEVLHSADCTKVNIYILSTLQLNSNNIFLSTRKTAENNGYHSIFVKYALRKSWKVPLCFDFDNVLRLKG